MHRALGHRHQGKDYRRGRFGSSVSRLTQNATASLWLDYDGGVVTGPAELEGRLLGGRYRLGRLLGRGGMGMVYEAHQEDLGRRVAIKLVRDSELGPQARAEALDRFQREARSAAALGNPHIIQIYDFQVPPNEPPYLVMELLTGETLSDALKREGPQPAARVARIGVHVLSALAAAHHAGILHRDIKPGNVFLTRSPTLGEIAKVLDFGIAKLASGRQLTQAGAVIGTALYMSPEQATGGELDGRADVYSTAVTMYRALTGKSPFAATSASDLLAAILAGAVIPLQAARSDVDPALAQIIARGMAADRNQRFQSADEMGRALEHWMATQAPISPPTAAAYGPPPSVVSQAPQSLGPASLGPYPPHSVAPMPQSLRALPAPAPRRGSKLPWVLGALGLLGVLGVALAAGGFFAVQSGVFDAEPRVDFADAGVAGSTPSAVATSSAAAPTSAEPNTAAKAEKGKLARDTVADAGSAAPSAAPAPAVVDAAAAPAAAPAAKGGLGSTCKQDSDCSTNNAECSSGVCACAAGTPCGQECALLYASPYHCGKCGNQCGEKEICSGGACKDCDSVPTRAWCKGTCVNTNIDLNNCGTCGNKCAIGSRCWLGKCDKK